MDDCVLPVTGGAIWWGTLVAAILVGSGMALVVLTRRRVGSLLVLAVLAGGVAVAGAESSPAGAGANCPPSGASPSTISPTSTVVSAAPTVVVTTTSTMAPTTTSTVAPTTTTTSSSTTSSTGTSSTTSTSTTPVTAAPSTLPPFPTAIDDTFTFAAADGLVANVLANDLPGQAPLEVASFGGGDLGLNPFSMIPGLSPRRLDGGTLSLEPDGTLVVSGVAPGTYVFSYSIRNVATVTLIVG